MIRSLSDINNAFDAGRFHVQRFQKNQGSYSLKNWLDATFSSGQPGYDARVGAALTFIPAVAQKNDAIYFPAIPDGMQRYLVEAQVRPGLSGASGGPLVLQFFDLLGYYPLIDGDSSDLQECTNDVSLTRYTDGVGVQMVMVNHIAPGLVNGLTTINYTDSDDVDQTVVVDIPNIGVNFVVSGSGSLGAAPSTINIPLANGAKGVKRVNSIQHTTVPGGLHCIYLVKFLGSMVLGDHLVAGEKSFITGAGFAPPRIYDGAWLGWFGCSTGSSSQATAYFGNLTFVWG